MEERKCDRRTKRTKKAIRDAFSDLLAEKELQKITVQEIADRADINRVTFYKHYLDVYDLYDKTEQDILVEIGLLILKLEELPPDKVFDELVKYIDENRPVFRMIFSPMGKSEIRAKFYKCVDGLFRQLEQEKVGVGLKDQRLGYHTCYRSHGCIAVLGKWINDGFSESKEFIAKTISELDANTERLIFSVQR